MRTDTGDGLEELIARAAPPRRAARLLPADGFLGLAAEEVVRAHRYRRPLAVALAAVDGIAAIAGADGEAVAEEVLARVAVTVIASLRGPDRTGRLGPAELGILLPEAGQAEAVSVARRLRARIGAAPVVTATGRRRVTLSIGVAALPAGSRDPRAFLAAACAEFRRAQRGGGDRVCAALPPLIPTI